MTRRSAFPISATCGSERKPATCMNQFSDPRAVPLENGATLATPPARQYSAMVERNTGKNADILLDNEPLSTLRPVARRQALAKAREYTRALGLDPGPEPNPEAPIIASGHQPLPFHPGIMIKPVVLVKEAEAMGATPLFITVDSDEFRAENTPLPTISGERLARLDFPLFPMKTHGLYEAAPAEPVEDMLSRFEAMVGFMEDSRLDQPRNALLSYTDKLRKRNLDFPDYVSRAIVMRRLWLAPAVDKFMELPVSILCQQNTFLRFATHIMADIPQFAGEYNRALDRYRKEHRLRYPANPFPNLEISGDLVQAPFWALDGGNRQKLFVKQDGECATVVTEKGEERPLGHIVEGKLAIRPKAITLSLYLRLVLCDLFIHGVGGAKYDDISDALIRNYFGAQPPELACLSATLWPDLHADDPRQEIATAEQKLRDIDQHPEKAGAGRPQIDRLAALKGELVLAIKEPGADKKTIGQRIRELNQSMATLLADDKRALEMELERLAPVEQERQVAQARDYPCFFIQTGDLIKMSASK